MCENLILELQVYDTWNNLSLSRLISNWKGKANRCSAMGFVRNTMRGRRMRLAFIVWMRSLSDCLSDSHNGMTIRHWLVFYCQLLAWQFNLEFNSTRLETQKSACYSLFSCRNDTCWRIRWIMYLFSIPIPSPLSCCSPCNVLMLLFAVSCSRHMSLDSLCSFAWKWLGVSKQGRFLYGLYLNKHWPEPNRWKITVVSQREAINTSSHCSHNGWNAPQWGKAQIRTSGQSWVKLVSAALNGGKKISKVKAEN